MNQEYVVTELGVNLDEREIRLPAESKILEVFYRVHVGDVIYAIGGRDRLMMFFKLRDALLGRADRKEMENLKLQYGMTLPNACFTGEIKMVIRALIPKPES